MTSSQHFGRLVSIALVGALALVASVARADDAAHQKALDFFHRGGEAYRAGHFQEAIDLLKQAYELEHDPTLLYNLARAYENTGDLDDAVATYQAYLRDAQDIKDRPAIEVKVSTLQKEIDDKAKLSKERDDALARASHADASKPPADADVPRARRPVSAVPWIIAGVGLAGIAAGAGVGAVAVSRNDAATKAVSQKDASTGHDNAKSLALGATIAFVAGGVVMGAGAVWGVVDIATRVPSGAVKNEVKVTVGLRSAAVTVRF